ncbi:MAG: ABC transporter ATP-binding protein [Microbacterium sp.]
MTDQGSAASTATPAPLLDVRDLRTAFRTSRGWVRAVDGVSLHVERGRVLGIVGESGSGKSVLSRTAMGTVRATENVRVTGTVRFEDVEITTAPISELRKLWGKEIAMIFQDPMSALNPVVKVGRQITEGLQVHLGISNRAATVRAVELLEAVGIPEAKRRMSDYPGGLSGGMRQRVSIAIALSCNPTLLFADEPTTALDVTVQAQILDLLAEEQRERDMSVVIVTHDLGVVAGYADEIAVMYAGRVVERAPTKVLFAAMRMPYTAALFESIPKLTDPSHTKLTVIEGRLPDPVKPLTGCRFAPRCPLAQDRCLEEEPPLLPAETPGHEYACWFPIAAPRDERRDTPPVAGLDERAVVDTATRTS